MDWYRRYTDRSRHPQLFKAGFLGGLAFDALCDVAAEFDLGGTISPQYCDPAWLAARALIDPVEFGADPLETDETPARYMALGLERAASAGLISREEDGAWVIDGWDRRQPKAPVKSSERVKKHRERLIETRRNAVKQPETPIESEKESEKEKEKKPTPASPPTAPVLPKEILPGRRVEDLRRAWNDLTALPLPRWADRPSKSRDKRAKDALERRSLEGEQGWAAVFTRVNLSSFCRGRNDRGWVADVDFVIRPDGKEPETALKVLEGKYDDRTGSTGPPKGAATAADKRWDKPVASIQTEYGDELDLGRTAP